MIVGTHDVTHNPGTHSLLRAVHSQTVVRKHVDRLVEALQSRMVTERVLQYAVLVDSMPYGNMPLIAGILWFGVVP